MNLTRQSDDILSRGMLPSSSAAALRQERITVIRNYWATVLAVVTKSAWYACIILLMVLNQYKFAHMAHFWAGYLDSIINDLCLVLLAGGGWKAAELTETLARAGFLADMVASQECCGQSFIAAKVSGSVCIM